MSEFVQKISEVLKIARAFPQWCQHDEEILIRFAAYGMKKRCEKSVATSS